MTFGIAISAAEAMMKAIWRHVFTAINVMAFGVEFLFQGSVTAGSISITQAP